MCPEGRAYRSPLNSRMPKAILPGNVGVQKISSTCDQASYIDTLKYAIPSFPSTNNQKGDILLTFSTLDLAPFECNGQDTLEQATFKFWVNDKGGHQSDTLVIPPITIEK